jgi:hypothetical protein
MSDKIWSSYSATAPTTNGSEVNLGYVDSNGVFSITDNGGTLVSKLLVNGNTEIHYVNRSVVSSMISNGVYTYNGGVIDYLVDNVGDFLVTELGDNLIV